MWEVVEVGAERLIGEVIRLEGERATIQVYEDTTGLKPEQPVYQSGMPLCVALGPGLVGNIYDGIQRPLRELEARHGTFIRRGEKAEPLDRQRAWNFHPVAQVGDAVGPGDILGTVPETAVIEHRVMVPPTVEGRLHRLRPAGEYHIEEIIAEVETTERVVPIRMFQRWPVRQARPFLQRLAMGTPLVTGLRIVDTFFPLAKGGSAAVPGGFGTGKTVVQHSLAKWSDADLIVYIGCGERGNEMTSVLTDFPRLVDPRSGQSLLERTILIANTSNMPVAAREVCIYTGVTLAEYYRDMGYHVAIMADSTSRWAEALRELSGRLEEMPAEEGFPAYLATRLAQFYERAGRVQTLGGRDGSVSIIGSVSPPGGDFAEPVTQHTRRFIRGLWALDTPLANARHYPAINWLTSYSEYVDDLQPWWEQIDPEWSRWRREALEILQKEDKLQQIVRLVGADVLPESQRLILFLAELLKDGFLQQNAFDEVDAYCDPEKQVALLRLILEVYHRGEKILAAGVPLFRLQQLSCIAEIVRAKRTIPNGRPEQMQSLYQDVQQQLNALERGAST